VPYTSAIGGMLALAAALGIGRFVYTPILPAMAEALGLGNGAAGLIGSANFAGYLVGALMAASPGLAGSRRTWLLGALLISALTTAGMGLADTLPAFLILRCVGGMASAFVLVLATAAVLEHPGPRRAALSALHFAGVGAGIVVSAVLVGSLIAAGWSWRALWLASGLAALIATPAAVWLLPHTTGPQATRHRPRLLIARHLRSLVAAYGLFGFGYVITATFLVVIVRRSPSLRAAEPMIWVAFGLAAAPSVAGWAWLADRLGAPVAFAAACVAEAVGVLASVAWPTKAGVLLAAILVGGTFMGLTALGLMQARALAPGDPRRVLAVMTAAFGLGQIIGPTLAGVAADLSGGFALPSAGATAALLLAAPLVLRRGT
jgi:predicted MFS family arabinose efflux permease